MAAVCTSFSWAFMCWLAVQLTLFQSSSSLRTLAVLEGPGEVSEDGLEVIGVGAGVGGELR